MYNRDLESACNKRDWDAVLNLLKTVELSLEDLEPLYGSAEQTILHLLAANGKLEAINVLLSKINADVNVRDKLGRTLVHLAVEFRHLAVVEALVQSGADVNVVDKKGHTPIHALKADKNSRGAFIKAAANIQVGDDDPQVIIQFLCENGVKLDAQNRNGETVLHHAAASGRADLAELLIDGGANAGSQDYKGRTPLHNAITELQGKATQVLLERSNSGHIANRDGDTPASLLEYNERFSHDISLQAVTASLESGPNKGIRNASSRANAVMRKASSTSAMPTQPVNNVVSISELLEPVEQGCCWTRFIQKICKIGMSRYD